METIEKHTQFIQNELANKTDIEPKKRKLLQDYISVLERANKELTQNEKKAWGVGCGGGALKCC